MGKHIRRWRDADKTHCDCGSRVADGGSSPDIQSGGRTGDIKRYQQGWEERQWEKTKKKIS